MRTSNVLHILIFSAVAALAGSGCSFEPHTIPPVLPDTTFQISAISPNCGNGKLDPGEECDDGNVLDWDGCSLRCQVENGWNCKLVNGIAGNWQNPASSCSHIYCQLSNGVCLDRNRFNGDGCSAACKVEPGWVCKDISCSQCTSTETCSTCHPCHPVCGDGLVKGREECDPSDSLVGINIVRAIDDCVIRNQHIETTDPAKIHEEIKKCYLERIRGKEGSLWTSEVQSFFKECEKTNSLSCYETAITMWNGCSASCVPQYGWFIDPSTKKPNSKVGDGIIAMGREECDDGNQTDGDGCDKNGKVEAGWKCSDPVSRPDSFSVKIKYVLLDGSSGMKWRDDPIEPDGAGSYKFHYSDDIRNQIFNPDPKNVLTDFFTFTLDKPTTRSADSAHSHSVGVLSFNALHSIVRQPLKPVGVNPFLGRMINPTKKDLFKNPNPAYGVMLKVNFVYTREIAGELSSMTFGGNDDVYVLINGHVAQLGLAGPSPVYREKALFFVGSTDNTGQFVENSFDLKEGHSYELIFIHFNRGKSDAANNSFSIGIPATVVGPTFCSKCGDGFYDPTAGEECDDEDVISGNGCSDTCKFEKSFTCHLDFSGKTHCWQP